MASCVDPYQERNPLPRQFAHPLGCPDRYCISARQQATLPGCFTMSFRFAEYDVQSTALSNFGPTGIGISASFCVEMSIRQLRFHSRE